MEKYTCPCCGFKAFNEAPGSYDICPICFWEDDKAQLLHLAQDGANINLIDAQNNYEKFGAVEERFLRHVRKPNESDIRDPQWRKVDATKDEIMDGSSETAAKQGRDVTGNGTLGYYWLKSVPSSSKISE